MSFHKFQAVAEEGSCKYRIELQLFNDPFDQQKMISRQNIGIGVFRDIPFLQLMVPVDHFSGKVFPQFLDQLIG